MTGAPEATDEVAATDPVGPEDPAPARGIGRPMSRTFLLGLLAVLALGLGVRMVALGSRPVCPGEQRPDDHWTNECYFLSGDAFWYDITAERIVEDGEWFTTITGAETAKHPPLYTGYLAVVKRLGFTNVASERAASSLAGLLTIPLVALVGRRLAGDRAGLIAGALAATYPMLWINEGQLLSESIYAPIIAGVMVAGYAFHDRPSTRSATVLGLTIGLAALTRPESLGLFAFMVVPIVWGHRQLGRRRQVELVGVSVVMAGLLLAPWVGFNMSRFEERVLFTTGSGASLRLTNCDATYYGEYLGYRHRSCWDLTQYQGLGYDESEQEAALRSEAVDYISEHRSRLPVIMAIRVGRLWDLYAPRWNNHTNWLVDNRGRTASGLGQAQYFAMLPFAVAGVVHLRRRREAIAPIVSMAVLVTLSAAITFGLTRYRVAADVALCAAAGVGLDLAIRRWWPPVRARLVRRPA